MNKRIYSGIAILMFLLVLATFLLTKTVVTKQITSESAKETIARESKIDDDADGYREFVEQITKPQPPLKSTFKDD